MHGEFADRFQDLEDGLKNLEVHDQPVAASPERDESRTCQRKDKKDKKKQKKTREQRDANPRGMAQHKKQEESGIGHSTWVGVP